MPCYYDPFTGTIGCTGVSPSSGDGSGPSAPCDVYSMPIPEQWNVGIGGPFGDKCTAYQTINTTAWGGTLYGFSWLGGPFCTQADAQAWIQANPKECPTITPPPPPPPPTGNGVCPTCPTCNNNPCTCKKKCYFDPSTGEKIWLGPNDQVPSWYLPCDEFPVISGQKQEHDETAQPLQAPAPLSCLIAYAWGSPQWCECAELWRTELDALGQLVVSTIQGNAAPGSELVDTVFYHVMKPIDLPFIPANQTLAELAIYFLQSLNRIVGHIDATYGVLQNVMYGVYALKAAVETVEALEVHNSADVNIESTGSVGFHAFGTGFEGGAKYSRKAGFSANVKFKLDLVKKVLDQLLQYFVPVGILGVGEAVSIFASGQTTLPQLRCMIQAAGVHPDWALPLAIASRNRPTAYEWVAAWRRGLISDDQLATASKSIGFVVPGEFDVIVGITNVLPPPSDLVRFMLRSIGDPQVVQQFQLEDEFDILFQGRIKEWAKANGVSEAVLRGYHAAHWQVPGPGDLATFWQRFNTARNSPQANALPNKLTQANYDRALREQGIAPYWRPFFQAAQYIVPGQRQIQYAFQYGQFTQDQLNDLYLDGGFRPEHAPVMVQVTIQRAIKFWIADPVVKAYLRNGINEEKISNYLDSKQVPDSIKNEVMTALRIEASESALEKVLALLAKAYELGQLDDAQLVQELNILGLDPDQIDRVVKTLSAQKRARPKQLPAQELCKMYGSRLIGRFEFGQRLIALQYAPYDAELIISQCERDLSARQLKQEQLALKNQAAIQRRQLSELRYEDRQAQMKANKAAKALAAQIKAQRSADIALARESAKEQAAAARLTAKKERDATIAEREELRILGLIEHITDEWARKTGGNPSDVANQLPPIITSATSDGKVTVLELLEAMNRVVALPLADLPVSLSDLAAVATLQVGAGTAISGEQQASGIPPTSSPISKSPIQPFLPLPGQPRLKPLE